MILLCFVAFLLALSLLVYFPVLYGEPINDDPLSVWGDPVIMEGRWKEIPVFWVRSLTQISWALCFKLAGQKSEWTLPAQHLPSILLHWLIAVLLIPLANCIGLDGWLVALIWLLHPLAVSGVATMSQRSVVMATFFLVLGVHVAILTHILLLFLPFGLLALFAKEDALGILALIPLVDPRIRKWLKKRTSDGGIVAAGVQGSFSGWTHFVSTFSATMEKWPLWFLGLGLSTDHNIPERKWKSWLFLQSLFEVGLFIMAIWLLNSSALWIALVLLLFSPMIAYWFVPLADPITEYRAYQTVLPIALIVGFILSNAPIWFQTLVILLLASRSTQRAFCWSSAARYWKSAKRYGRPLRRAINLMSAYQNTGQLDRAESVGKEAVAVFPGNGILWANLALITEARARQQYLLHCQRQEQLGNRGIEFDRFVQLMQTSCLWMDHALRLCPNDPMVNHFHGKVHELAKTLKVPISATTNAPVESGSITLLPNPA